MPRVPVPATLDRFPCTPNPTRPLSPQITSSESEPDDDAAVGEGRGGDGPRRKPRDSLLLTRQPRGDTSIPTDEVNSGSGVSLNPDLSVATIRTENKAPDNSDVAARHVTNNGNRSGFDRDHGVRGGTAPPIVSKLDGTAIKAGWAKASQFQSWDAPREDVESCFDVKTAKEVSQMVPIGWMTHKGCNVQKVAKKVDCSQRHKNNFHSWLDKDSFVFARAAHLEFNRRFLDSAYALLLAEADGTCGYQMVDYFSTQLTLEEDGDDESTAAHRRVRASHDSSCLSQRPHLFFLLTPRSSPSRYHSSWKMIENGEGRMARGEWRVKLT